MAHAFGRNWSAHASGRLEDSRLLRGRGRFVDDLGFAGELHGVAVRSTHPSAGLRRLDTTAAVRVEGVMGVITGHDLASDGVGGLPSMSTIDAPGGGPVRTLTMPLLASDVVRYVGEPVAFVVAESLPAAQEAAEHVVIDYAPKDCVTDVLAASEAGAPLVQDGGGGNVVGELRLGERMGPGARRAEPVRLRRQRLPHIGRRQPDRDHHVGLPPPDHAHDLGTSKRGGGVMSQASRLSPDQRAVFAGLADLLIPRHGRMPAATEIGAHAALLDWVLGHRPDIVDDLLRGLAAAQGAEPSEAANRLSQQDPAAFNAITLAASATYYMAEEVRGLIGYPGQEKAPYDPHETPVYSTNRMIERLVRRGPIYRPTPDAHD